MGWRFRRTLRMGPIRWNFSRRGIGGSWGFPGFRVGVAADGRRYLSVGVPGTGLYYQHYFGRNKPGKPGGNAPPSDIGAPATVVGPPFVPAPTPTSMALPIVISPDSPRARLVVQRGGLTTSVAFDVADRTIVGRAGGSAGQVDLDLSAIPEAPYISAHHAEIRHDHRRGWIIRDLGSQNGSFVRRAGTSAFHRILGEEVLRHGDEVAFGNARFEFQAA